MPTRELNQPNHRWYKPENHIHLPREDYSMQWIYPDGIRKIDEWIGSGGATPTHELTIGTSGGTYGFSTGPAFGAISPTTLEGLTITGLYVGLGDLCYLTLQGGAQIPGVDTVTIRILGAGPQTGTLAWNGSGYEGTAPLAYAFLQNNLGETIGVEIMVPVVAFSPAELFAGGEQGAWYDPSDLSTMFTDTAGTSPAAVGQQVARINDKSGRGNHAVQATLANQPFLREAGGLYYLEFDGSNDRMSTASPIAATGGQVQVFGGVRRLSDAIGGVFTEFGTNVGADNGSFSIFTPSTASTNIQFRVRGTLTVSCDFLSGAAPESIVISGLSDITNDRSTMRRNGVDVATRTSDHGLADFDSATLFIGTRNNTGFPLNGHLYGLIVRFAAPLTADQVDATEAWLAEKAGVTLGL